MKRMNYYLCESLKGQDTAKGTWVGFVSKDKQDLAVSCCVKMNFPVYLKQNVQLLTSARL